MTESKLPDAPSSASFPCLMAALDEHLKNADDPFMVSFMGKDNLRDLRDCIREQQAALEKAIVGHDSECEGGPSSDCTCGTSRHNADIRATLDKWRIE